MLMFCLKFVITHNTVSHAEIDQSTELSQHVKQCIMLAVATLKRDELVYWTPRLLFLNSTLFHLDSTMHFPPLLSTPAFSTPAFSIPAVYSRIFHSCIFHSHVFSAPALTSAFFIFPSSPWSRRQFSSCLIEHCSLIPN